MPPDHAYWIVHVARAEIDLLRGDIDAAIGRLQLIHSVPAMVRRVDFAAEAAQRAAEAALWAGRPGDAQDETRHTLALFTVPDLTILCGQLQSPRRGLFALPPLRHWSRGLAVLLGGAAHAMLPRQGQGASRRSRTPPS